MSFSQPSPWAAPKSDKLRISLYTASLCRMSSGAEPSWHMLSLIVHGEYLYGPDDWIPFVVDGSRQHVSIHDSFRMLKWERDGREAEINELRASILRELREVLKSVDMTAGISHIKD